MDDHQEMLLELVEKSVRVIPLDKKEWEKRGGLAPKNNDDNDRDSLTTTSAETDPTNDPRNALLNGSVSSVATDHSFVYPTLNYLRKACLATPPSNTPSPGTSNSPRTRDNRKTMNRKALIAALEKWIAQNHSKSQKTRACPCVKVLSSSRLKEEKGADSTNPKHLLDTYVRNERASDPSIHDRTRKPPEKLVCAMHLERDPSRSLLLRCNNTLVDGEVYSENTTDAVSRNGSNNSLMSGMTNATSSSPSRTAILRCAASLFYRIWYFRTIRKKDLRRAFGFALASSVSGSGSRARVSLRVTFLMLEKPTDNLHNSPPIGGRYPLYVYKKRYDLPRDRDSLKDKRPSSTASLPSYSSTVLEELAVFLYHQTETLPCPYRHTPSLSDILSSPGGMLLPDEPRRDTAGSTRSSSSLRSTIVPMHLVNGCRIVPTITGSLVIHCRNARAVRELLERSGPGEDEREEDREGLRQLVKNFKAEASNSNHASSWYVKYKTPSFGLVWRNSSIAINGPRGSLKRRTGRSSSSSSSSSRNPSSSSSSQNPSVQRWAFLHPIDSWVGSYRSIIITRSAGIEFSKAVDDYGLSWAGFQREFLGLAKATLEVQKSFNNLVHGDIHEGNVLFYPPFHNEDSEAKLNEDAGGSNSLFSDGHRLILIDWDEASRPKPFRREALTTEARMRYPEGLIDFPKQYTEQQLMHLFAKLAEKYYPAEIEKVISGEDADDPDIEWIRNLMLPPPPPSSRASTTTPFHKSSFAKFLSRSAVEQRYKSMLRGLQGDSWWSMNWAESGLDDGSYHLPKNRPSRRLNDGSIDVRKSALW